jgi:hypothetical protein
MLIAGPFEMPEAVTEIRRAHGVQPVFRLDQNPETWLMKFRRYQFRGKQHRIGYKSYPLYEEIPD